MVKKRRSQRRKFLHRRLKKRIVKYTVYKSFLNPKLVGEKTMRKLQKNDRRRVRFQMQQRLRNTVPRSKTRRPPPELKDLNIEKLTGITSGMVMDLYDDIKSELIGDKESKLCPLMKLILVLTWMRNYPKNLELLIEKFDVCEATVTNYVDEILPKLVCSKCLHRVHWFDKEGNLVQNNFENHVGSIDGTHHRRNRIHPGSYRYFRFDKGCFFIAATIVTNPNGRIMYFSFAPGHNNDQGQWNRSVAKRVVCQFDNKLLADGGYSHQNLITPDKTKPKKWNDEQKQKRSIVEIVIGYIKNWAVAECRFRGTPEKQQMALYVVYQLAAWKLELYPIRYE